VGGGWGAWGHSAACAEYLILPHRVAFTTNHKGQCHGVKGWSDLPGCSHNLPAVNIKPFSYCITEPGWEFRSVLSMHPPPPPPPKSPHLLHSCSSSYSSLSPTQHKDPLDVQHAHHASESFHRSYSCAVLRTLNMGCVTCSSSAWPCGREPLALWWNPTEASPPQHAADCYRSTIPSGSRLHWENGKEGGGGNQQALHPLCLLGNYGWVAS